MRYEKDGFDPIETSLPAEGVRLRAEGWRPVAAGVASHVETRPPFDEGGSLPTGVNSLVNESGSPEPLVAADAPTETPDDPEAGSPKRRRSK